MQYKEENRMTWKRIGWNTLIKRCIDGGYFKQNGKTPYESAFYEPFENVLKMFNIENAIT